MLGTVGCYLTYAISFSLPNRLMGALLLHLPENNKIQAKLLVLGCSAGRLQSWGSKQVALAPSYYSHYQVLWWDSIHFFLIFLFPFLILQGPEGFSKEAKIRAFAPGFCGICFGCFKYMYLFYSAGYHVPLTYVGSGIGATQETSRYVGSHSEMHWAVSWGDWGSPGFLDCPLIISPPQLLPLSQYAPHGIGTEA